MVKINDVYFSDIYITPEKVAYIPDNKTLNGLEMFIGQAIASEEIWTGKTPNADAMKIAVLENL